MGASNVNDYVELRMAKYMDVHKNNPPYTYKIKFGFCQFFFDGTMIFIIEGRWDMDTASRMVSALNQAYLEGWLNRLAEEQWEKKEHA